MPLELLRLDLLQRLDISSNMLTMLPKLDWYFLEELVLDFNHMTLVPKTIYEDLTAIRVLSLIENPLTRLPTDLGQMPNIVELRMNVHFTLVSPPTIVLSKKKQLRFLRELKKAEKTGGMELIDFDLNILPREISNRCLCLQRGLPGAELARLNMGAVPPRPCPLSPESAGGTSIRSITTWCLCR